MDNNFLTTLATGVTEPVAYGATPCGMLELDADGYLYLSDNYCGKREHLSTEPC